MSRTVPGDIYVNKLVADCTYPTYMALQQYRSHGCRAVCSAPEMKEDVYFIVGHIYFAGDLAVTLG